jgi:hypothetical protein
VKVTFRRLAQYEFDEAADWYDGERIGLGAEFQSITTFERTRLLSWRFLLEHAILPFGNADPRK